MLVGTLFVGDNDSEVALKQHDVYFEALGIIVSTCNRFARFAIAVLDDSEHEIWGQVESFDHRTLQGAHDLLAAAWRFSNKGRQDLLPFSGAARTVTPEKHWLDWLRTETASWIHCPQMVRLVQLILANQNNPTGYASEASLALLIMDRFDSIPWETKWREAHESSLRKNA